MGRQLSSGIYSLDISLNLTHALYELLHSIDLDHKTYKSSISKIKVHADS